MRTALGLALIVVACAAPPAPPATGTPPAKVEAKPEPPPPREQRPLADDDDEVLTFDAIVRVDAEPGGKKLQAVWLERGDGERWIVAYRPESWLTPFADKTVEASGSRYVPGGQAVKATHFRVDALRVKDDNDPGPFVSLGAEESMTGRFVDSVGAPGTKGEGEHSPEFATDDGNSYRLANHPEALVFGAAVRIKARPMQYSKLTAHRGGPMIWVLEIGS